MDTPDAPPALALVTRNGVVESVHRGHVAVCDARGRLVAGLGEPRRETYVRSSAKPFQALAVLDVLDAAGLDLSEESLAIACASHVGADDHQIEAAHVLALAGLDEAALGCPPAVPLDRAAARDTPAPHRLAHNCSGKHAGFLLAQVTAGRDPGAYLDPAGDLQKAVADQLSRVCGTELAGPGLDGCGAPAWRLPLAGLATAFARLAGADEPGLARVRRAMRARPDLVGGPTCPDTRLMVADARVVAKRGAEAVFAAAVRLGGATLGVAVKVDDGGDRAAGPIAAAVLRSLGARVPEAVLTPAVLAGGAVHGHIRATPAVEALCGAV